MTNTSNSSVTLSLSVFPHQMYTYLLRVYALTVERLNDCMAVCVCVLALCGFASQTQFSNSSASLHYSYRSEPADSVTLRPYSWYFKVPFATITPSDGHTHTHTLRYTIHMLKCAHTCIKNMMRPRAEAVEASVTRERCRRLQEVTKAS